MILGRLPMGARMLATAWLLKSTFALQSLVDAAESVRAALEGDDLDAARAALRSLVSRDVTTLSPAVPIHRYRAVVTAANAALHDQRVPVIARALHVEENTVR